MRLCHKHIIYHAERCVAQLRGVGASSCNRLPSLLSLIPTFGADFLVNRICTETSAFDKCAFIGTQIRKHIYSVRMRVCTRERNAVSCSALRTTAAELKKHINEVEIL